MSFAVGERVSWKSGAGGHMKEKYGVVVQIVPPNVSPTRFIHKRKTPDDKTLYELYNIRPMSECGYDRSHESYLIAVEQPSNSRKKPKLHWPRVAQLRKVINI